jgi:hypothetical protein
MLIASASPAVADDQELVKSAGLGVDGPSLLAFLKSRSLDESDVREIEALVRQLGDDDFEVRERASRQLIARGRAARPFLEKVLKNRDPEVARRASEALQLLEGDGDLQLQRAVLRLLAKTKPAGAVETILRFLPFEADQNVQEEGLSALVVLGTKDGLLHPALVDSLREREPVRRGAAAFVVGRSGDASLRQKVFPLLADADEDVRFRAIQGLLAARERRAVPPLIDFLKTGVTEKAYLAEDILIRLAGENSPVISAGKGSPEERARWHGEWSKWWTANGEKVDLARIDQAPSYLGYTLVCEMHGDRIWEVDRHGKVRWEMKGLAMPRDAQVLPGGRVLVAEVRNNMVTERDMTGKVLWQHNFGDPSYVRRLPNGNTFLGNHDHAVEITPKGDKVFEYAPTPRFLIHSMNRKPNGNLVCLSMQGLLLEVDRSGKELRRFQLDNNNRNWSGVEGLPGNRYLAVDLIQGEILELDHAGKTLWSCKVPGASYALRLPTGNTMVCSFDGRRVVHVDRAGKIVWEQKVDTSPWRAVWR